MRKLLITFAISLSLAGCASLDKSILHGGLSTTASVNNPVTREMLYGVENGAVAAAAALVTYRRLCLARTIPGSCRNVIARIQPYTRAVSRLLPDLRWFVRQNDQVNAIQTFNTVRELLGQISAIRAVEGVN